MRQVKQYVAGIAVAVALLFGAGAGHAQAVAPVLDDVVLGKADAPVTVIEYASLTCPHCAHFANDIFDKVKSAYIDTGKVKWIYRDFPLDEMALRAAMMARCGGADRYYGFIEIIFKQQQNWIAQKDPLQALAQLGRLGGISEAEFNACMNNQQVENVVLQSRVNAQKQFDVDSTPSFIIGGKKHAGALEIAEFAKLVDPLLPAGTAPAAPPPSANAPAPAPAAATPATATLPGSAAPGGDNTMWIVIGVVVVVVIAGAAFVFSRRKSAS